jgi:hypothetical protein
MFAKAPTAILPISAPQVAGILGVSHWCLAHGYLYKDMYYGCVRHSSSPPQTVLLLECINSLFMICYVWTLMSSVQMDEKKKRKKKAKGLFLLCFYFPKKLSKPLCFYSQWGPCRHIVDGNFRSKEGQSLGGHNL